MGTSSHGAAELNMNLWHIPPQNIFLVHVVLGFAVYIKYMYYGTYMYVYHLTLHHTLCYQISCPNGIWHQALLCACQCT